MKKLDNTTGEVPYRINVFDHHLTMSGREKLTVLNGPRGRAMSASALKRLLIFYIDDSEGLGRQTINSHFRNVDGNGAHVLLHNLEDMDAALRTKEGSGDSQYVSQVFNHLSNMTMGDRLKVIRQLQPHYNRLSELSQKLLSRDILEDGT